ncbi:MAG: RCC1 domain-containing protein [Porticoccaceae bacterium]|nr:RCC1 domain-containing protein [Porticoccaceae bacterium]
MGSWGAANIVNVPSLSNPTQVTVGFNHACAQDDTGVVCWGNNDKGKRIVPTLEHVKDSDGDGVDDAIDGDRLNAAVQ